MFILKESRLLRFRRFLLGNTNSLDYNPTSPYQIFIGPNGSGKSAMQRVITPFPSNPKDFYRNGILRNKFILNEDTEIECVMNVDKTTTYEFNLNGVNLNNGGTLNQQKDLVEQYFGINQTAYQILTDKIKFTALSPQAREKLLTELSKINLDCAYNVYNQSRAKLKQKKGALNEITTTVSKLKIKLMDDDELATLIQRKEDFQNSVIELLKDTEDESYTVRYNESEFTQSKQEFKRQFNNLLLSLRDLGGPIDAKDVEDAEYKSSIIEQKIAVGTTRLNAMKEEWDNINDLGEFIENQHEIDIPQLKKEHEETEWKLKQLEMKFSFLKDVQEDPTPLINIVDQVIPELSHYFSQIRGEDYNRFNHESVQQHEDRLKFLKNEIARYEHSIDKIRHQLNHVDNAEKIACPKCQHEFLPNITEDQIEKAKMNLEEGVIRTTRLNRELEEVNDWLTEAYFNRNIHTEITRLLVIPMLEPLSKFLKSLGEIFKNPQHTIQEIVLWRKRVLGTQQTYYDLKVEQIGRERLLSQLAGIDQSKLTNILERKTQLEISIENSQKELISLEQKQKDFNDRLNKAKRLTRELKQLTTSFEDWNRVNQQDILSLCQEAREITLKEIQLQVALMEQTINEQQNHRELIRQYELKLEELENEVEALSRVVEIMSPKTGLIAEQMFNFVSGFLERMNEIINEIWSYPIQILPRADNNESLGDSLNYLFPMMIKERKNDIAEDISLGSDGQVNIINFAFKVAALVQLGLTGTPLLMDEVDRTFQPKHKVSLMNYVRRLIEYNVFSQLFVISHHESCFDVLQNSEVINLDPGVALTNESQLVKFFKG